MCGAFGYPTKCGWKCAGHLWVTKTSLPKAMPAQSKHQKTTSKVSPADKIMSKEEYDTVGPDWDGDEMYVVCKPCTMANDGEPVKLTKRYALRHLKDDHPHKPDCTWCLWTDGQSQKNQTHNYWFENKYKAYQQTHGLGNYAAPQDAPQANAPGSANDPPSMAPGSPEVTFTPRATIYTL